MNTKTLARTLAFAVLAVALALVAAACTSNSHSADAQAGRSAEASVTANPQFIQAKKLVVHCFAGTPVQQAQQVHLVFLSSATGKNGPAVIAARAKVTGCLGISKSDEQPFLNDAITAAEHAHLVSGGHAARVAYLNTLATIVIKYSNAPGVGNGTASIPGTTPGPSVTGSAA